MAQELEAVMYQGSQQPRYDYTPTVAKVSGEVCDLGGEIGIVTRPEGIAANTLGSVATDGIFKMRKAVSGGITFSRGDLAEWDDTTNTSVQATLGDFKTGVVIEDSADAHDHVKIRINKAALN